MASPLEQAYEAVNQAYRKDKLSDDEYMAQTKALRDAKDDWMTTTFAKSFAKSAVGMVPGAMEGIGRMTGADALAEKGQEWQQSLDKTFQVNPDEADSWSAKLGGGFGSVAGIMVPGGVAGMAARGVVGAVSAASKVTKAAKLAARADDASDVAKGALKVIRGQAARRADTAQRVVSHGTGATTAVGATAGEGARDYEATMAKDGTPVDYEMRQDAALANAPAGMLDYILPARFMNQGAKLFGKGPVELMANIKAGKNLIKPKMPKAERAKGVAAGMAIEGATEAAQQAWLNKAAKMMYDQERDVGEGVIEAAAIGSIVGGALRGTADYQMAKRYENSYNQAQKMIGKEVDAQAEYAEGVKTAEAARVQQESDDAALANRNAELDQQLKDNNWKPKTAEDLVADGETEENAKSIAAELIERAKELPAELVEEGRIAGEKTALDAAVSSELPEFNPEQTASQYVESHPEYREVVDEYSGKSVSFDKNGKRIEKSVTVKPKTRKAALARKYDELSSRYEALQAEQDKAQQSVADPDIEAPIDMDEVAAESARNIVDDRDVGEPQPTTSGTLVGGPYSDVPDFEAKRAAYLRGRQPTTPRIQSPLHDDVAESAARIIADGKRTSNTDPGMMATAVRAIKSSIPGSSLDARFIINARAREIEGTILPEESALLDAYRAGDGNAIRAGLATIGDEEQIAELVDFYVHRDGTLQQESVPAQMALPPPQTIGSNLASTEGVVGSQGALDAYNMRRNRQQSPRRTIAQVVPGEARREVAGTMSRGQANNIIPGKSPHYVAGKVAPALSREASGAPRKGDKALLEKYRAKTDAAFVPSEQAVGNDIHTVRIDEQIDAVDRSITVEQESLIGGKNVTRRVLQALRREAAGKPNKTDPRLLASYRKGNPKAFAPVAQQQYDDVAGTTRKEDPVVPEINDLSSAYLGSNVKLASGDKSAEALADFNEPGNLTRLDKNDPASIKALDDLQFRREAAVPVGGPYSDMRYSEEPVPQDPRDMGGQEQRLLAAPDGRQGNTITRVNGDGFASEKVANNYIKRHIKKTNDPKAYKAVQQTDDSWVGVVDDGTQSVATDTVQPIESVKQPTLAEYKAGITLSEDDAKVISKAAGTTLTLKVAVNRVGLAMKSEASEKGANDRQKKILGAYSEIGDKRSGEANDAQPEVEVEADDGAASDAVEYTVRTPGFKHVNVKHRLVDSSELYASNDKEFDARGGIQPREISESDRTQQIINISNDLDHRSLVASPKSDDGAPIVADHDLVVDSGNGRVMAIRRAYTRGLADKYKQHLIDNANELGIDADKVRSMPMPILVRQRTTPMTDSERHDFVEKANDRTTLAPGAGERAASDARMMSDATISKYAPSDSGTINQSFIDSLMGEMSPEKVAEYTRNGRLTDDGKKRVKRAVFAKAYEGNKDLIEMETETRGEENIKNILTALNIAAPAFAKSNNKDVIPIIAQAVRMVQAGKQPGMNIQGVVAQRGLDFGGPSQSDEAISVAGYLAATMEANKRKTRTLGNMLAEIANDTEGNNRRAEEGDMFGGDKPRSAEDIIRDAVDNANDPENTAASQQGLKFALSPNATITQTPAATAAINKDIIRRNNILKNNGVRLHVNAIHSPEEIPEFIARDLKPGERPRAVLVGDQAYLFTYNLKDEVDGRRAIVHEVVGHHGVRGLYGSNADAYNKALDGLYGSMSDKALIEQITGSYGGRVDKMTAEGRRKLVEEYVAHKGEQRFATDPGFFKRLYRTIRQQLRKWGIVDVSDGDINDLLDMAYNNTLRDRNLGKQEIPAQDVIYSNDWRGFEAQYALAAPATAGNPPTGIDPRYDRQPTAISAFFTNATEKAVAMVPGLERAIERGNDIANATWSQMPIHDVAEGRRAAMLGSIDDPQVFASYVSTHANRFTKEQLYETREWMESGGLMANPTPESIAANPPPAFLDEDALHALRESRKVMTDIGQRLVELNERFGHGWLTQEKFDANVDFYAPVLYADYIAKGGMVGGKKVSLQHYLKSKKILGEGMDAKVARAIRGRVNNPFLQMAVGIATAGRDVATATYMGEIAKHPELALPETFSKIESPRGGKPLSLPAALEFLGNNGYLVHPNGNVQEKLQSIHTYEGDAEVRSEAAKAIREFADRVSAMLQGKGEGKDERSITDIMKEHYGQDITGPQMLKALKDDYSLVEGNRYGPLSGRIIRKEIKDDIDDSINPASKEQHPAYKALESLTTMWKKLKVPLNVISHVRNAIGNFFLLDIGSDTSMMVLAADTVEMFKSFATEVKQKDINAHKAFLDPTASETQLARWITRDLGGGATTFSAAELHGQRTKLDRAIKEFESIAEGKSGTAAYIKMVTWATKYSDFMMHNYQQMEQIFKAVAVKDYLRKVSKQVGAENSVEMVKALTGPDGKRSPQLQKLMADAMAYANDTIFDYSRTGKTVNVLRKSALGAPFLTFFVKAIPATVKAYTQRPQKMIKYHAIPALLAGFSTGWDEDEMKELERDRPQWMRDKGSIWVMPFKSDDDKRIVVDFGYFTPQAGLTDAIKALSNIQAPEGPMDALSKTAMGLFGAVTSIAGAPAWSLVGAMQSGQDPFTKRAIIPEGASPQDRVKAVLTYGYDFIAPSMIASSSGVAGMMGLSDGLNPRTGEEKRSTGMNVARMFGINSYKLDPQAERRIRRMVKLNKIRKVRSERGRMLRNKNNAGDRAEINLRYNNYERYLREQLSAMG